MIRKIVCCVAISGFLVSVLYIPWNQVQTNGTGDGSLKYNNLGYSVIWDAPKATFPLLSSYSKVHVEPDWIPVFVAIAVFGIIMLIALRKGAQKKTDQ